jgi:hypothetical protein
MLAGLCRAKAAHIGETPNQEFGRMIKTAKKQMRRK